MQKEYINENTDRINIYESRIRVLQADSNNNIVIIIRLVHNPQFDKEVIGVLEITGFSYIKEGEKYIVQFNFDFNPIGIIRIKCTKFAFFVSSEPFSMGGNDNRIKQEE